MTAAIVGFLLILALLGVGVGIFVLGHFHGAKTTQHAMERALAAVSGNVRPPRPTPTFEPPAGFTAAVASIPSARTEAP